jgi:hypothetical protein
MQKVGQFAMVQQPDLRLVRAVGQADAVPRRPRVDSPAARPPREILFMCSQRVQIAGQLTPKNPADKPAEILLERIMRKRANHEW